MNPGSLENHMTTSRVKRPRTLSSPKVMGPSRRCCSRITLYAAMSFSVFSAPHPQVFLKLEGPQRSLFFLYFLSQVFGATIRSKPWCNSLEPHEDKLQPEPGQREHEDHIGEGKTKPRGKVDHIPVLWKEPSNDRRHRMNELDGVCAIGCRADDEAYWFICPLSTRLGPVPVSVAVPPMLAA